MSGKRYVSTETARFSGPHRSSMPSREQRLAQVGRLDLGGNHRPHRSAVSLQELAVAKRLAEGRP
jgi:hypothetical protein